MKAIWTRFPLLPTALDVTASRLEHSFHALEGQPQRADGAALGQHAGSGHRDQPARAGELVQRCDAADHAEPGAGGAVPWCTRCAIPKFFPR